MPQVTVNESIGDFTHVVKLNYLDLIAIGTGLTKNLIKLPAGSAVDLVGIINTVDFAGSSTVVIDVGYSGAATAFISAWDGDAATVMLPVFNTGTDFVQTAGNTVIEGGSLPVKAVSSATDIRLTITDAALASLTAGEIVIGFRVINLGRFA